MTSTELRRMLADRARWPTAIYTLANHADALVALLEACELMVREAPLPHAAVADALAAVHAVRGTP